MGVIGFMVKINFNTPIPHCQRDKFIHAMRDLGFTYERIYQNGECSLHKFSGKLPLSDKKSNIDILVQNDVAPDIYNSFSVGYVEMFFLIERS